MRLARLTKDFEGKEIYVARRGNAGGRGRRPFFKAVVRKVSRVNAVLLYGGEELKVRVDSEFDCSNSCYDFYETLDHLKSVMLCQPIAERFAQLASPSVVASGESVDPAVVLQVAQMLGVEVNIEPLIG